MDKSTAAAASAAAAKSRRFKSRTAQRCRRANSNRQVVDLCATCARQRNARRVRGRWLRRSSCADGRLFQQPPSRRRPTERPRNWVRQNLCRSTASDSCREKRRRLRRWPELAAAAAERDYCVSAIETTRLCHCAPTSRSTDLRGQRHALITSCTDSTHKQLSARGMPSWKSRKRNW